MRVVAQQSPGRVAVMLDDDPDRGMIVAAPLPGGDRAVPFGEQALAIILSFTSGWYLADGVYDPESGRLEVTETACPRCTTGVIAPGV